VPVATFRAAAVRELQTWLAVQPTDLPADAVGGADDVGTTAVGSAVKTHASLGAFVGRLSLIVVPLAALAFVFEERRRARREHAV
jgi:hypothetical protein